MTNRKIIFIIILVTVFGFSSGVIGSLVARVYLFEKLLDIPLFGDIDLSQNPLNRPNVVISGARNVVVEQDIKVQDTLKAVENSFVGIFNAKIDNKFSKQATSSFSTNEWYALKEAAGQGTIITSDGWIVSPFAPKEITNRLPGKQFASSTDIVLKDYVIISRNKKIYAINQIVYDPISSICFYRIIDNDLPVGDFSKLEDINNGQMVVAANWQKQGWLTTIIGHETIDQADIYSSDDYQNVYILEQNPPTVFNGSFLFTLENSLAGIIDYDGLVVPVDNFLTCLNCLLENNILNRPVLGLNYLDVSNYVSDVNSQYEFGALILSNKLGVAVAKGSPAESAGLRANDLILSIDNIELKDGISLNREISKKLPGNEIILMVKRGEAVREFKIVLGEK
jgi:hypothetical protein